MSAPSAPAPGGNDGTGYLIDIMFNKPIKPNKNKLKLIFDAPFALLEQPEVFNTGGYQVVTSSPQQLLSLPECTQSVTGVQLFIEIALLLRAPNLLVVLCAGVEVLTVSPYNCRWVSHTVSKSKYRLAYDNLFFRWYVAEKRARKKPLVVAASESTFRRTRARTRAQSPSEAPAPAPAAGYGEKDAAFSAHVNSMLPSYRSVWRFVIAALYECMFLTDAEKIEVIQTVSTGAAAIRDMLERWGPEAKTRFFKFAKTYTVAKEKRTIAKEVQAERERRRAAQDEEASDDVVVTGVSTLEERNAIGFSRDNPNLVVLDE